MTNSADRILADFVEWLGREAEPVEPREGRYFDTVDDAYDCGLLDGGRNARNAVRSKIKELSALY